MANKKGIEPSRYTTKWDNLLTLLTIIFWVFILGYAITLFMPRPRFTIIFVGSALVIYSMAELFAALDDSDYYHVPLLVLSLLIAILGTVYVSVFFLELFYERLGNYHYYEILISYMLIMTVFYLSYRAFGFTFAAVGLLAIAYGYFGFAIPGLFGHIGLSTTRISSVLVLEISGFYGSISRIIAAWVSLFLLYTGLVKAYGAFDLLLLLTAWIASRFRSGVALLAVFSSMLVGSINGSPSANTAMTGSITIPLMKQSGMPSKDAGAVEATASCGGQIMPPIMGSAAFIMASILGISYTDVLIAGLMPAALFAISVTIGVHYLAIQTIEDGPTIDLTEKLEEKPSKLQSYLNIVKFGVPFGCLIYFLGVAQWNIMTAAMITVVIQIFTGFAIPIIEARISGGDMRSSLTSSFWKTIGGFRYGALILAPIAVIIALINGVVDITLATGLPGKLSLALLDFTEGSLIITAILAMGISLLLGMGMPSVAAYAVVAFLVAPTLISVYSIPELAAHYFVFYSAVLSFITPPIANAVVVSSGIANSNFWQTCSSAIQLSATLFLLPLVFVYKSEIVTEPFTFTGVLFFISILIGILILVQGINHPGLRERSGLGIVYKLTFIFLGIGIMVNPDLSVIAALSAVAILFYGLRMVAPLRHRGILE